MFRPPPRSQRPAPPSPYPTLFRPAQQGIDPARVRFEAQSRNTAENARLTAALVGQGDGRPWLLVTSAWHMPRAVASFRAAGLEVLAYPVDFRTEPARLHWPRDPGASLGLAGLDRKSTRLNPSHQ